MLQMITDLLRVNRLEKQADSWILTSAVTGSWVTPTASGVGRPTKGNWAMPIFTESKRDGSAGFTGDVSVTKGVTVLYGNMEARTDQFVGTPAIGDKLYVTADGKLGNAAGAAVTPDGEAAIHAVARCTKAPHTVEWFGNDALSVIEFVTI